MLVTCLSASHTKSMGANSTSTRVCKLIEDRLHREHDSHGEVAILPLMDYDLMPCHLCGKCSQNHQCVYDEAFNRLFNQLSKTDLIFLVVPHYSPIPSKLLMVFEKMNEIACSGWLTNKEFKFPLKGKTVGIIGHGGMPENDEVLDYYHNNLVTPVAKTLKSLSLDVIGMDERFTYGAVFGLRDETCIRDSKKNLFPDIIQDWSMIEERIKPFIHQCVTEVTHS